ncbi:hypothetical protein TNCV_1610141 [Trichonephila clavipes]|nr:hypothetical protein TNCV_1610141 [Trichonephila clavipes]
MRKKKLHPGVPPPTTECNKGGSVPVIWQNQARRLPGVHPECSDTASGWGSNGRLTGAGSLLPPVYSEAWAKGIPRTPFSSLRDANTANMRTGKEEKMKFHAKKRVEKREGSLGYPEFVRPVFTKESKPLGKRKISLGYLGIVTPVLT